MKNIKVRDESDWWETYIPVVERENDIIVFCNHAGADIEPEEVHFNRPSGFDALWVEKILVCYKCDAWKREDDEEWTDAPYLGVHYEK